MSREPPVAWRHGSAHLVAAPDARTMTLTVDCAARIKVLGKWPWSWEVTGYGRYCSRRADDLVCGIPVCSQHRNAVTTWADGEERLAPNAERVFATWGVTPSAPFYPEYDSRSEIPEGAAAV